MLPSRIDTLSRSLAACLLLASLRGPGYAQAPDYRAIVFPYVLDRNIDRAGFPEPSGLVYHPGRGTLFVVSDEGHVAEMSLSGDSLRQATIGGDMEGITVNPATGLLYVAVEGRETIVEVDPEGLTAVREFSLERTFEGRTVMRAGGQGIEGIAFLPDAAQPDGGTFLVCNQGFDLADTEDGSAIFEVEVPLAEAGGGPGKLVRRIVPGVADLADLFYDATTDHLLVICDSPNLFLELARNDEVTRCFALPGDNQEGITLDGQGNLYLAQDSGGIIKFLPPKARG